MSRADPSLRALQAAFHGELLGRSTMIARHVHADARLPAARRLHIYGHAYRTRLRDALRDTFEKTARHLGDAAFDEFALAFTRRHPPRHRNLRWYGARFGQWLAAALPDRPEVAELAALDWQLRLAFDTADDACLPALTAVDLAGVDWARAGCRFTTTLALLPVRSNAAALWHALETDAVPPAAGLLAQPAWLLVWRKAWQAQFRTLEADEHALLAALRSGQPVAAVCAERGTPAGTAALASLVAACLPRWIDDALVIAFTAN